jgi:hypothetical protein
MAMYVATIVKDREGRFRVRIGTAPMTDGDVTVVDILNGDDREELVRRARHYVKDLIKERDG